MTRFMGKNLGWVVGIRAIPPSSFRFFQKLSEVRIAEFVPLPISLAVKDSRLEKRFPQHPHHPMANPPLLACARPRHVEALDPVLFDELSQLLSRIKKATSIPRYVTARFAVFLGKPDRLERVASN